MELGRHSNWSVLHTELVFWGQRRGIRSDAWYLEVYDLRAHVLWLARWAWSRPRLEKTWSNAPTNVCWPCHWLFILIHIPPFRLARDCTLQFSARSVLSKTGKTTKLLALLSHSSSLHLYPFYYRSRSCSRKCLLRSHSQPLACPASPQSDLPPPNSIRVRMTITTSPLHSAYQELIAL